MKGKKEEKLKKVLKELYFKETLASRTIEKKFSQEMDFFFFQDERK